MSQWPGHGTKNTTLPGTRIVNPEAAGMRSRRTMRCVPRLGRMAVVAASVTGNAPSGRPDQTPVASMTARARIVKSAPPSSSRTWTPAIRPRSRSAPWTRSRVAMMAPRARAVRATARAYLASSSTPSWNMNAPRSRARRRTGVCSRAASTPR